MKHVTFLLALFLLSINLQGQIANGDFENWESVEVYEQPTGFATGNRSQHSLNISGLVPSVPFGTFRVDGLNGGSAVRLETVQQSIASTSGTVGTDDIFLSGFETMPYTGTPNQISVIIRHSIVAGDSSDFLFSFIKEGNEINRVNFKVGGELSTFNAMTIDVPAFSETPDALGIRIRNSDNINPASWLEIDLIEFGGTPDQIPNNSFDNWDFVTYNDPVEWSSSNFATQPIIDLSGASQSTDAFSGSSSLRLEAIPRNQLIKVSTSGLEVGCVNRPWDIIDFTPMLGSSPINDNDKVSFMYKFQGTEGETALVLVNTFNNSGDVIDDISMSFEQAENWTLGEIPLKPGATTLSIGFAGGYIVDQGQFNPDGGSILLVDDVKLNKIVGTKNFEPLENFTAYYNKSTNEINVKFDELIEKGQITLFQTNGVKLIDRNFEQATELNQQIRNLTSGIYILDVITENKRGSIKLYID